MEHQKFKDSIPNRVELVNELLEEVKYLTYDINPIGPPTHLMWRTMRKESLKQINVCREILNKIELSLNDC